MLTVFNHGLFAGADENLVIIKDFKFVPQEVTIKQGQVLRWQNREKRQYHSVWFEAQGEEEPEDEQERTEIDLPTENDSIKE